MTPAFRVNQITRVDQRDPQVGDAYGVYARSYDTAYGLSATEFQMNASGERWQYAPAVAAAADDRFVAAWHENDGMGSFWIRTRVFSP